MIGMGNIKKILAGGLVAGSMLMVSTTALTGCLTKDEEKAPVDTTTPAKHTAIVAAVTIAAGAQGATLGSVLDLDAGVALGSAAANAAQGDIDLVFMFYASAFHMDNAVAAKAAAKAQTPVINLANSYDDALIKDLKIVKVTVKPADQEAAKAAYTAGTASPTNVIAGGEMFVVMTTGGKLALVTVGTIVGTDNKANASFMVSVNTI
jgi:hypothetical protein